MNKETIGSVIDVCFSVVVVASVFFGFRPMLEKIFGTSEIIAYIGEVGGALIAATVIMCIKGLNEDEKELDRLRELERKQREDRD